MKAVKKILGLVWMLAGPLLLLLLLKIAISEMVNKPVLDTRIQWIVFILIFIPIAVGLSLFGYYAFKGEYDDH